MCLVLSCLVLFCLVLVWFDLLWFVFILFCFCFVFILFLFFVLFCFFVLFVIYCYYFFLFWCCFDLCCVDCFVVCVCVFILLRSFHSDRSNHRKYTAWKVSVCGWRRRGRVRLTFGVGISSFTTRPPESAILWSVSGIWIRSALASSATSSPSQEYQETKNKTKYRSGLLACMWDEKVRRGLGVGFSFRDSA